MASNDLSRFDDRKLAKAAIWQIIESVKRGHQVSLLEVSLVHGTTNGLFDTGELVLVDGYLQLAVSTPTDEPAISEIDRQIAEGKQSNDPAYQAHAQMLVDCTQGDWLEQMIEEDRIEEEARKKHESDLAALHKELALAGELLFIEGLKCKNYDRNDNYWLFVGNYDACYNAHQTLLHEHLIRASLKPNGATGCYKLRVDRLARGYIEVSDYTNAARVA